MNNANLCNCKLGTLVQKKEKSNRQLGGLINKWKDAQKKEKAKGQLGPLLNKSDHPPNWAGGQDPPLNSTEGSTVCVRSV